MKKIILCLMIGLVGWGIYITVTDNAVEAQSQTIEITPIVEGSIFTVVPSNLPETIVPTEKAVFVTHTFSADTEAIVANMDFVQLASRVEIYTPQSLSVPEEDLAILPATQVIDGVTVTYKFWDGQWREVFWVASSFCEKWGQKEIVKLYVEKFQNIGAPLKETMTTILGESSFQYYVYDDGKCRLKQNNEGAPAYGAGQIFKPAHPAVDWIRLATDPVYGTEISVGILHGAYVSSGGNDWTKASAWYKGFANDPNYLSNEVFKRNYLDKLEKGGFNLIDGTWVSFDDSILEVLK